MAYPVIFFLLSIPPLINRIQSLANPRNPELALWYIAAMSFPLSGGLIAVVYVLQPDTRKRLRWKYLRAGLMECIGKKGQEESAKEYPIEYVLCESIENRAGMRTSKD